MTPRTLRLKTSCTESMAMKWASPLEEAMVRFGINTPTRQAYFLANLAHESQKFTRTRENMNYSWQGLRATFPKYFTLAEAQEYHRQPERIANHVYCNRMGNRDEASGDGFKFRGGGLIHLTGATAYLLCGLALDIDLFGNPQIIEEPKNAADSAGWFWQENNLNRWADAGDFDGCCDSINRGHKTAAIGDSNGYADRLGILKLCMAVY